MSDYFCISATFLDRRYHGRGDGGEPEWPPSPLRLMQAIVAANSDQIGSNGELDQALEWLERQKPPLIIAPRREEAAPYCLSVPNNAMDIVGRAWARGNYFGTGDANPATHRAMKTIRPLRLIDGDTVHFVWKLSDAQTNNASQIDSLMKAANRITALGWGIDLVIGHATRISADELRSLGGERWMSTVSTTNTMLRTPIEGALAALKRRYSAFLDRVGSTGFAPVEPLAQFVMTGYRRPGDPFVRPCVVFELRYNDGSFCIYSQRKLIHIAGMVRHLAKEAMLASPPAGVDQDWVERYVVGHRTTGDEEHRQFSYLPLPSIGHNYADQSVRRVMVAASVGDEAWLEHLSRRLAGKQLVPERGHEFGEKGPPSLLRVRNDKIANHYTKAANRWHSVTPVILPGHDDRKASKTRRLIEAALVQSGIDQPCTFEWSPHSKFRNSHSAHKYDKRGPKDGKIGYIRPDHLETQTAVHLTLEFEDGVEVPGPLVIGAGRHCGLGLMSSWNPGS